jgi:hypothetical protein
MVAGIDKKGDALASWSMKNMTDEETTRSSSRRKDSIASMSTLAAKELATTCETQHVLSLQNITVP